MVLLHARREGQLDATKPKTTYVVQHARRLRAGIYQHRLTVRTHHDDALALTNINKVDSQPIRLRSRRARPVTAVAAAPATNGVCAPSPADGMFGPNRAVPAVPGEQPLASTKIKAGAAVPMHAPNRLIIWTRSSSSSSLPNVNHERRHRPIDASLAFDPQVHPVLARLQVCWDLGLTDDYALNHLRFAEANLLGPLLAEIRYRKNLYIALRVNGHVRLWLEQQKDTFYNVRVLRSPQRRMQVELKRDVELLAPRSLRGKVRANVPERTEPRLKQLPDILTDRTTPSQPPTPATFDRPERERPITLLRNPKTRSLFAR